MRSSPHGIAKMSKKTHPATAPEISSTPTDRIREDFKAKRIQCGSIELYPLSLSTFWLLEEIKHPFMEQTEPGAIRTLSMRDTARAILICHNPDLAGKALHDGIAAFDMAAMELARKIPAEDLFLISAEIAKMFKGTATMQGKS